MQILFKKIWNMVTHVQVLCVFLAFALMVFFSYYFMSNIERNNLLVSVEDAISNTQIHIESDLMEPSTALGIIAENVRGMILNGAGPSETGSYFYNTANYFRSDERLMSYAAGIYGFFDTFGGILITGTGWLPPDDYIPEERPWYKTAVEAEGKVTVTEPYTDIANNALMLTFSRQIFDDYGNSLGIVCLDIMLDRISEYAINTTVSEDSYGILFDKDFNVLAHPHPAYVGRHISMMNDGEAIQRDLEQGRSVSERKATDYNGNESVLFVRQLNNGWYLAILAYAEEYYQNVTNIGFILILLAFIFGVILSAILLSIVSSRKKAEDRTMMMLDSAPVGVTMWDRDINLIDFNYEAARVLGMYSKQEYREKFGVTAPEFQPDGRKTPEVLAEFIGNTFEKGQSRTLWHHNTIKGETIPFDAMAFRINYKNDQAVIVYCTDLREINAAIARMREADERAQIMLDATPLAGCLWDKEFNIIDCNLEALRLFDFSEKKEYIERFPELSPEYQPDGRLSCEKCREYLEKAFEEGYCRFEWLHRKLNGELIPCDITLVRVRFRDENIVCGYTRDLRELKTMIAKMREADECTQILFDASPLACVMIDNTFNVLECNQEVTRLFEVPNKQIFIERFNDFSPEYQPSGDLSDKIRSKYISEAFEEGSCRFEWLHQTLDGEQIPSEIFLVRVKFKGVYAVAGYIRDLRELKLMIAEMRRAEIAEESSKAKSDFLAKMSHEIRTPMNAILGITEIQLQDNSLSLSTREALERIYNSGDLLLGIINDILDLSKIEAGKLTLVNAKYDVASLIHDVAKLNIIRYESKPIEFKLVVSEDVPTLLIGDELRLKQILNNLLSNAFKYTQEGMIELALYTEPLGNDSDRNSVMLVFRISDTGQGMTSEQVKKLGEKFSRFNQEANRKTEGTGLGMNITRNLIQLMKGRITIESTPGMGSTFTVWLPHECADASPIGKELADNLMKLNMKSTAKIRNTQIKQEFMPYGSILVVDDVETNLYVARGLMTPYGLTIDTALSGFEAVSKIKEGHVYDVIFMDHMMPKMDGIETTKLIRSLNYTNPIVALTANAIAGQEEIFLKNGFDDFISKPIDIRQLNAVLNRLIRDKQPDHIVMEARREKNSLYASGRHNIAIDPQLAEFFIRDGEKAAEILETIYSNNFRRADDIPVFIVNIHAMKSALANVGESELSGKASQLEQAGRDQSINLIMSELPGFLISLHKVIDKLKPYDDLTEEDKNNGNKIDIPYINEKLLAIEMACASMDKKSAKDALSDLKEKTWPKAIRDKLSVIAKHLLHSEFDEAAAIARDLFFIDT